MNETTYNNPIPRELILKAIDNLASVLTKMPEGQAMNDLVDGEIRRLMAKEHPGVAYKAKDIDRAIYAMADDHRKQMPVESNGERRVSYPNGMTEEELNKRVAQVAGFVKLMCGVANNAALVIMIECLNKIADKRSKDSYRERPYRPHPRYRQKVKQLFSEALRERDQYRLRLLYGSSQGIRFFHLGDMPAESRRKYGIISDEQYFEFWEGTGSLAYQKSQPLIGSLHNKFRLSMLNHRVPNPEQVAWGLVGANMLELAVVTWQRAMRSAHEAFDGVLTEEFVQRLYYPFSLEKVSQRWQQALELMAPETKGYELDEVEERNIALGVEQIMELWISPDLPFDSTIQAVDDFSDDIFSTRGQAKKAMRELAELRESAIEEFRNNIKD